MSKSIKEFIQEMKAITERTESNIIAKIGVVDAKVEAVNTRMDKMAEYIMEENKTIIERITKLEQHVIQPSQKCEAPKSVNTVQYNNAAQQVQPIGTCKVWNKEGKKWDVVNFFGFCKTCGDPILSPSVIAYCSVNKLDTNCYPCQKGKKRSAKYMDITLMDGRQVNKTNTQPIDTSVVVKCDVCGKPRKYKSSEDYLAKKRYAESLGLPGTMCTECAREALNRLHAEDTTPKYEDPIEFERQRMEDKRAAREAALSVPQQEEKYTIPAVVEFLLTHGMDEIDLLSMRIADLREVCKEHSITLAFDGNEWNRNKVSVIESVDMALIQKGKETDEMMHPENPHKEEQEVVDVVFEECAVNQGF